MAEELKVTLPAEYKKKFVKTKLVKAPSGAIFKIKQISALDFVNNPLPASETDTEKSKQFTRAILTSCVVEPKIVDKKECEENEISLHDIRFDDYIFLSNEITAFSTSGNLNFLTKGQNSST